MADPKKGGRNPIGANHAATPLKGQPARRAEQTSLSRLAWLFLAWKLLLLLTASLSPGPGYDTSTLILFDRHSSGANSWLARRVEDVVLRLTRWDALYFASASSRGLAYEQEWAFSPPLSQVTSVVARVLFSACPLSPIVAHSLAGVLVAHVSHWGAVIALYRLVYYLVPSKDETQRRRLAFTTACLHIVSAAGLFLSAPYGEAPFALFNILGMLCYVTAVRYRCDGFAGAYQLDACWTLAAGICFAVATMIRSNGLLSGLLFAWDALAAVPRLLQSIRSPDKEALTRLFATVAAGTLLATGFALPQAIAYREYCTAGNSRPWCSALPPSIYTFVQDYYWDVGLFRYWKVSNLPLFAIAFPVGWIMAETAISALSQETVIKHAVSRLTATDGKTAEPPSAAPTTSEQKVFQYILPRFALPQLILVVLAATSFHCQIINRISSGYPLWYFILAIEVCRGDGHGQVKSGTKQVLRPLGSFTCISLAKPEWVVRAMAMYALVQGGLYAAFLPPA